MYKAMKGVETVAVKVCSALVGSEDKACKRTSWMRPRATVYVNEIILTNGRCALINDIADERLEIGTAGPGQRFICSRSG